MLTVEYSLEGTVAVIQINSPPVNALSHGVRSGLMRAITRALAEDAVEAIVIAGSQKIFSGGADIREFGQPAQYPSLVDVIDAIEQSPKPVVAAIHGVALGGGLELTLACHGRLAADGARLGLPEVTLGLIPGAGGTQRLPRLVPLTQALPMLVLGEPVDASSAAACGLIDRAVEPEALFKATQDLALDLARRPLRMTRDLPVRAIGDANALIEAFSLKHEARIKGRDAPAAALAALRDAVSQPVETALARERAVSLDLRAGAQSRALRHLHFAERQVFRYPGLESASPRAIERVGIVGAGTMGRGIALSMISAGLPVTLVEPKADILGHARTAIANSLASSVAKGRMLEADGVAASQRLTCAADLASLDDADLIVEAAYERMEVKQDIFARLDQVARPGAMLASNTSYLDIDAIASATRRPQDVVGLHFFSPANLMRLLEIVRGDRTAPDVLATSLALARRIAKIPVVAGNCHGFIGNRMLAVRRAQAEAMLTEGADIGEMDEVVESFGFPMGPFRMADLAGLDLGWSAAISRGASIRERLNEAGRHGQKAGAGFYDYDAAGKPSPSSVVMDLVRGFAAARGIVQRRIGRDEMRTRLFLPMIDEGVRILAEGIALRPGDIDVVWVNGYGWPRHTGGPMHYAEAMGLAEVANGLSAIGLKPSRALSDLVAAGAPLASLAHPEA
ncbi:3-hydroxyacyl-CoA dehydrogenase NAD-binding domain-containing protein [Sphingobium ummariense]|nr:3-hydroxyacyl-CoA dehydrogenase NAD-binding domain-containing protein [Sphingobium ummariense]